jgi:hypothetical protein
MDKWVDEAQREIEEAKKAWSSCSHHGVPEDREDCRNIKKVTDRIIVESEKLVITIRRNMQMLDKYLTMDDIIADIDNSISQWLSQIICMLDTSVLSLSTWFVKNKRRLEMWIELYYLMDAFKEIFNSLKDVFVDYENYCPFCQSDRGESHTGIFDIVFNVDISPPIIRFPRLPDIAIDLSQVKGGVILPVPRPQLHFVSLVYPKLEPLDLMGPPLWGHTASRYSGFARSSYSYGASGISANTGDFSARFATSTSTSRFSVCHRGHTLSCEADHVYLLHCE